MLVWDRKYAVYRKHTIDNAWQDFVLNAENAIATSLDVNGVCPPPHSGLYTEGLTEGDICLRLLIQDGGVNDADGIANGSIDDPGGIAVFSEEVIAKQTDPVTSSSGGGTSWIVLLFLAIIIRLKPINITKV